MKRVWTTIFAALTLLLSLSAARAEGTWVALEPGDKGEAVRRLQSRLIETGFLEGEADGVYGSATKKAVLAFEENLSKIGLGTVERDGLADANMQEKLFDARYCIAPTNPKLGDAGADVARLQKRLIALKYLEGKADGRFGENTDFALKAFQTEIGREATGVADAPTQIALYDPNALARARLPFRPILKGDYGETVRYVKEALARMGYLLPEALDGELGSAAQAALAALEENCLRLNAAMYADWFDPAAAVTVALQEAIESDAVPVYEADAAPGDVNETVKRIQRRLYALGYLPVTLVDSAYGEATKAAIEEFQANMGVYVTGLADEETQSLLFHEGARYAVAKALLKVSTAEQRVYAYLYDVDGEYKLAREMVCSTGAYGTATPLGVYRETTAPGERWHYFVKYDCWAQYTYRIIGNILFHSVLFGERSEKTLRQSSVNNLGKRASHGCVRLAVEDAKWLYENCPAGSIVVVY